MTRKLTRMIVLAAATAVAPSAVADDGAVRIVIPARAPASRPSDADTGAVTDAQSVYVVAQREADTADSELVRAQGEWKRVARQLRWEMDVSRDMIRAKEAVNSANAAYEASTRPALDSLSARADYRDACAALARAQQAAAGTAAVASFEQRVTAAQVVLDCKAAVYKLQRDAFDGDAAVAYARGQRAAAAAHLRDVRARLQRALLRDPKYVAASQAVQDAENRAMAGEKQLAAAKLELSAAIVRVADKEAAWQEVSDWARRHGLPDPP